METTDKRMAILEATLDLIYEQGFHATPVSQIAERANVGAGSVYRYFKNKDDLLNQLYLEVKQRMFDAMRMGADPNGSFEPLFKLTWLNVFDFHVSHPREFYFSEQYCNSPILTAETKGAGAKIFSDYASAINRAIQEGVIMDLPTEMIYTILHGTNIALVKMHLSGGLEMTEQRKKQAAHAAWCAVRR